ncbi:MAG: MvaI/BcnI family restriction endonuclease [Ignavibacteria bacterium]
MNLNELTKRLRQLSEKGFIKSQRKGPTGIGHLLESELGLSETNIAIPDIGGRVELKATRKDSKSLITLFTFNKGVWRAKQNEIIKKYGYFDKEGRESLYSTVTKSKPNQQGFFYEIDLSKNLLILKNIHYDQNLAEWSVYVVAGKFMTKLDRILFVLAEAKLIEDEEYFHFNEAYLLENPSVHNFLEAFEKSLIQIDIRMHIRSSGGVRNHGTGFRIYEKDLISLYSNKRKIL